MKKNEHQTYKRWDAMKQRCLNPKTSQYHNYGGRGITVCEKWLQFDGFLEDMGTPEKGMTLDRIDNNKGYCKENCRWVTNKINANNKRTNHFLTFNNKTHTLSEWEDITGVKQNTILTRIRRGWGVGESLELERHITISDIALEKRKNRKTKCKTCKKVFYPRPYQLKMGQGKYCSTSCSTINMLNVRWGKN